MVARPAPRDDHLVVAVAVVVAHLGQRPVDRDLREVRPAEPDELGVEIGEEPRLQQRVVGEVDAGHDVADVEGDLLGLGEEVVRVAVEHQAPDRLDRDQLLRDDLRGVEQVEVEGVLVLLGHELHAELPLGEVPGLDRLPQVLPVEVGVLAAIFWVSSQTSEWMPSLGFQWNFTKVPRPSASTSRKVCTPNPCIIR
nr:hypothetical protein GCM10020093_005480 [Planobispora longispora]